MIWGSNFLSYSTSEGIFICTTCVTNTVNNRGHKCLISAGEFVHYTQTVPSCHYRDVVLAKLRNLWFVNWTMYQILVLYY